MLQGYLGRLSLRPGEATGVHVSAGSGEIEGSVARLVHSDPSPLGPGEVSEPSGWPKLGPVAAGPLRTRQGSYALVEGCFAVAGDEYTLATWLFPTLLGSEAETVVLSWETEEGPGGLVVRAGGRLTLVGGGALLEGAIRVRERQWYFVGVAPSRPRGSASLFLGQLGRTGGPFITTGDLAPGSMPLSLSPLGLGAVAAAGGAGPAGGLDGKLAAPRLVSGALDAVGLMDLMNSDFQLAPAVFAYLARWDLGDCSALERIVDLSPNRLDGVVVNAPARLVGDHTIAGVLAAPPAGGNVTAGLAAIHFHTDDLDDCAWGETFTLEVPEEAASGIYSLRLAAAGAEPVDLPFVVGQREPGAPVLFLVPTFTWQAYANLGRDSEKWPGLSHYALHRDGSPVYVTSRLKPSSTFGPGAFLEVDGGDGFADTPVNDDGDDHPPTHLLMADLYVEHWLRRTGIGFAHLGDEDLHRGGEEALVGARALVLSAHPEYFTAAMLGALEGFLRHGGNIMYLGGNGLYWVTSVHPERPHLLEVRRCNSSQTASAEAVECGHSFERVPGGSWAAAGRPPNAIVGVGFSGFGWDQAIPYRRLDASRSGPFAWVFEGVEEDEVGSVGLNMGGAVAMEIDRRDVSAGSAEEVVVLASGIPEARGFFRPFEEGAGCAPDPLVRADMTMWRTPHGGRVFALGSITASGCLPVAGGENSLARVCTNVLRDFVSGAHA